MVSGLGQWSLSYANGPIFQEPELWIKEVERIVYHSLMADAAQYYNYSAIYALQYLGISTNDVPTRGFSIFIHGRRLH
jgi:hypothetical protein